MGEGYKRAETPALGDMESFTENQTSVASKLRLLGGNIPQTDRENCLYNDCVQCFIPINQFRIFIENSYRSSADGVPVCKKCTLNFPIDLGSPESIFTENFGWTC